MYLFKDYLIFVSDKPLKKYYALVNGKKIYFGDSRYQHYHDKLGYYKDLDHNDNKRRRLYYARHGKKTKKGSARWFSHHVLW